MSLIDLIDNGLNRAPHRPCLIDKNGTYLHGEVRELSHRVANGLRAQGLERGSRVAILSPNVAPALVALIGILRAGAVWLPVQVRNALDENVEFLAENACEYLFFHSSFAQEAEAVRSRVAGLKGMVCLDASAAGAASFHEWVAGYPGTFPDEAHNGEDPAWVKSTGGTTGKPKSVVICQRNVETLLATFHLCMPLADPHVNLAAAPVTHGAGNIALCIIFGGGTVVLIDRAEPNAVLEAIETHRVTTVFLPPTVIYSLLAMDGVRERRPPTLKYLISAGAPISAQKLAEAIEVFGPVMVQAWGQTEAPFICTYLGPDDLASDDPDLRERRLKSCGRSSPLTRVEIMDDDGALLPAHSVGEMVVRGNLVMLGYRDRPEENEAVSRFGWHHTGDVGYRDDDGYFYIVDRKKDMIISGGFNIYPSEVEQVLWRHPDVLDCAVIGVPDPKWGEALKAVIELKPGRSATEDELKHHCRAALGGMKTPKTVEFWPSLPRSEFGKVLKRQIRERYWAGHDRRI
ncbi:AMP-binding protein [Verticiella sediminum]|uniref:AMP-binding protein n=1 Tax=Verticiella sediminum TaxID=1247510 RepID=A0A556AJH7_9BURK|nr:AMP-binding protein [Verticiella sediminum]TSH93064.1 AMP-binding protein [Verticiella sediminum]